MAQTDNASDLQKILFKVLPIGSILERDSDKVLQQALRVTIDRLLLETLKMLYKGEELLEFGTKKDLDVAATKAFVLRVVNREGWDIGAEIKDPLDKNPIEIVFKEKLASAR
ncbi:4334_t:CDS:2 [Gigaspora margarita]|uniref:4334_t:CDS:1 n=1 Tax=Gigaspora margarita TaxID=4874 RepID=A0ABN7X0F5_GIGMA|nr:4334_t:CDS:2 [Gigaspora margarita]